MMFRHRKKEVDVIKKVDSVADRLDVTVDRLEQVYQRLIPLIENVKKPTNGGNHA